MENIERFIQNTLTKEHGISAIDILQFNDGFSFTVPTELDAYKSAHYYSNYCAKTIVNKLPKGSWHVEIYMKGTQ